jgi:hypothetical protein
MYSIIIGLMLLYPKSLQRGFCVIGLVNVKWQGRMNINHEMLLGIYAWLAKAALQVHTKDVQTRV